MEGGSKLLNLDKEIDCIGLFCPMPIVKIREAIKQIAPGQLIGMVADDPASEADMKSWCRRSGHELLEIAKDGGLYRFVVRRTP